MVPLTSLNNANSSFSVSSVGCRSPSVVPETVFSKSLTNFITPVAELVMISILCFGCFLHHSWQRFHHGKAWLIPFLIIIPHPLTCIFACFAVFLFGFLEPRSLMNKDSRRSVDVCM